MGSFKEDPLPSLELFSSAGLQEQISSARRLEAGLKGDVEHVAFQVNSESLKSTTSPRDTLLTVGLCLWLVLALRTANVRVRAFWVGGI